MPERANFPVIFQRLKVILESLASEQLNLIDAPDSCTVATHPSPKYPRYPHGLSLVQVQVKKNYVSYHLMPVYMFPHLLEGISQPLKKRMQGKACFNFTTLDEPLIEELTHLTTRAVEYFQKDLRSVNN